MTEKVIIYDGDNPGMALAEKRARETFKFFWRELSWEYRRIVPAFDMTMIKAGFSTDSKDPNACKVEHMWATDIDFDGKTIKGVLVNQPNWISNLKEGDNISIPFTKLEDWMIMCNGKAYGGFTVHQMRSQMGPTERRDHDDAWGLDFGDPDNPRVFIEKEGEGKEGFFSGRFGKKGEPGTTIDLSSASEHQMSENMAGKMQEAINENPDFVSQTDSDGWTMLHREALAGNLAPVRILLKNGADPTLKNPNGHTPLDLAQILGWPSVMNALKSI